MDNSVMKETYIKLLRDTLERKLQVVEQLLFLSRQQEEIIAAEIFDDDQFMDIIDAKGKQIEILNQLDSGFEKIYQNVSRELTTDRDSYRDDITALQELIKKITDISISIQALEKRNKDRLEAVTSRKRKDIRDLRANSKHVANYYKSMSNYNEQSSYFYDKKN